MKPTRKHNRNGSVAPVWADRLTELIRALHLTPAKFFRLTNVPTTTGYQWLEGKRIPDLDNPRLLAIVEATNVRWAWLTDGSGNMFDEEA